MDRPRKHRTGTRSPRNANQSRRSFLTATGSLALGFTIVPRHVLGGAGYLAPSERVNLAGIGAGGGDIATHARNGANVVALCDVDDVRAAGSFRAFPKARRYKDFRVMLDKEAKNIDAVTVGTPDHIHAVAAMAAIRAGKHVYCQKPLTHTLYECRTLSKAAHEAGVMTQMGNQGHATEGARLTNEWIQAGLIGDVRQVHVWTDRAGLLWKQGIGRPKDTPPIPSTLDWNLWLGPVRERPYHPAYVPHNWRGWRDFGTGAMGDMGCHIIDPPFTALKLTSPNVVWVEGPGCTDDMHPAWEIIHYEFPGTEFTAGKTLPLTWYDGHHKPKESLVPLGKDQHLPDNGSIFIGDKGSILLPHVGGPQLLPREEFAGYRRPKLPGHDHYVQWVNACLGKDHASANFDFAGPLTETVLLGVLAGRFPGKKLQWDAADLKVTNLPEANQHLRLTYRKGWEVEGL